MSSRSILLACAAIGLAATGLAGVASAQNGDVQELVVTGRAAPDVTVKAQRVTYYDLDLSNYDGARALLLRIDGAAKQVCNPDPDIKDMNQSADYRGCLYDAVSRAVSDVDSPAVSDLYSRW